MKRYAYIILIALILALIGFFLYGRIEHSVGQPKGRQDFNCSDFEDQQAAQKFYIENGGPETDQYRLDGNKNLQACEGHPYPKYKKIARWKF